MKASKNQSQNPGLKWNAFITEHLKVPEPIMERAHGVGLYSQPSSKPCTIIAKFSSCEEKGTILEAAKSLRRIGYMIYQDYSYRAQQKHQELFPQIRDLWMKDMQAFITYDPKESTRLLQPKPKDQPPSLGHLPMCTSSTSTPTNNAIRTTNTQSHIPLTVSQSATNQWRGRVGPHRGHLYTCFK